MQAVKIVVTGAYSAGKSHFVRAVSDIDVLSTEYDVTDPTERLQKAHTTVALDFGTLAVNDEVTLYLFGTPGQERFDFMWEILQEGALGLVVLVDNARPSPIADLERFLDAYDAFIGDTAAVVGVTRTDVRPVPARQLYVDALAARGLRCPVFTVDARDYGDVSLLLRSLLYCLDPQATMT